ncbi:MAG: DUF1570 domain-containing protein [Planctomycetaceae bacterium]|nr:DUF1570 domain-containing protein [Planctomycetaceae bacterium]
MLRFILLLLTCFAASFLAPAFALDYVTFHEKGKKVTRDGRIVKSIRQDGDVKIVLEERDGFQRIISHRDILEQWSDETAFVPYSRAEMKKRLAAEFPKEFRIVETKRYLIVFDTTLAYANWCGNLLEQLDTAFLEHWQAKGFDLSEPEFPLVAVIFADYGNFVRCTRDEVGPAVTQISAYYNQQSNRIVFYDLTGREVNGGVRGSTSRRIREILSRPESAKAVSTFVHEAVHQISYNCGMFQRYSACPIWVSEGIATLYETPDFNSVKAWSSDIKVNRDRLNRFYRYVTEREPREPMRQLVESDVSFTLTNGTSLLDSYATCWVMLHFLNANHGDKLVEYLKIISEKQPFIQNDMKTRLDDFERVFGSDWSVLHRDAYQYALTLGQ